MDNDNAKIGIELGFTQTGEDKAYNDTLAKIRALDKVNLDQSAAASQARKKLVEAANEQYKKENEILAAKKKQADEDYRAHEAAVETNRQYEISIERLGQMSQRLRQAGSQLQSIGRALTVVSAATLGGMYYAANREANRQKSQSGGMPLNENTERWLAAQERIQAAYQRTAQVAINELLPFLEKAADIAERTADFVERHPELVKGVAAIGAVAGLAGTVMSFVGGVLKFGAFVADMLKGLKIYQFAQGANTAAESAGSVYSSRLAMAAAGASGTGGTTAVTATTAGTVIGAALVYAIAAYVGAKGGETLGNTLGRAYMEATGKKPGIAGDGDYKAADAVVASAMLVQGAIYGLNKSLGASEERLKSASDFFTKLDYSMAKLLGAGKIQTVIEKLGGSVLKLGDSAEKATDKISGTANAMQALSAYSDYLKRNADAAANYANGKARIEQEYTARAQAIYQNHAAAMASIQANLQTTLSQIQASYVEANIQAQQQYQDQYAQIVQQGQNTIQQIMAASQERLQEMARDHAHRVEQLTNSRDALGLAQEDRRYKEEVAAEKERTRRQVAEARRQTQQQLAELQRRFQEEQAARERQYQEQMAQAQAQAAAQQAAENANYQLQLQQLSNAKAAELKQLEDAYRQELLASRRALIQRLHDLGYYTSKEVETARLAQATMLTDLDTFWKNYSAEMSNGLNSISGASGTAGLASPGMAVGGYKYAGLYRVEPGKREFMLNTETTRAAEQVIGNRLTQDNLLSSLFGGGGNQIITVQVGDGMTLMQAERKLKGSRREFSRDLDEAIRSVFP